MPELPEVETIRAQLSKKLPLTVSEVKTSKGLTQNITKTKINIKNKTITHIKRKGKMLDFVFDDQKHLLSHLGMTGTWLFSTTPAKGKHAHLALTVQDNKNKIYYLTYDDPRRFGKMYFLNEVEAHNKLAQLGLDLAAPQLNLGYLKKALSKYPSRMLKVTLLDQKLFAGSGNYIANEICARAHIKPDRLCKNLRANDFKNILQALKLVIRKALKAGGTTFQGGYRDSTGEKGQGKSELVVFYQKTCGMCKQTLIKKIMLAQRGTYYCPSCQK